MCEQIKRKSLKFLILIALILLGLSACEVQPTPVETKEVDAVEAPQSDPVEPTATPSPVPAEVQPSPTPTLPEPTATPTPTEEPSAINPLTGEQVADPQVLYQRPLMVSVSNFPVSSRPQAGLSLAAQVWETYIGEGMTRYLAIFYGDYYQYLQQIMENRFAEGIQELILIGPVRSGRVVYEDIKTLFEGARMITAGASAEVGQQLTNRSSVYGSDPGDINSAGVGLGDLEEEPAFEIDPAKYSTLTFGLNPPANGSAADTLRIVYNYFNQIGWTYDPELGAYLRSQDKADGTGTLFPATDQLTGEQLAFENVMVMWAQHRFVTPTIIEMELVYVWDRKGLLFRDGEVFDVKWSTRRGELTIHDKDGNPIPLKPGATFFEVVSWQSTWNPDSLVVRYHNPPME
jgi:hypothetical protein